MTRQHFDLRPGLTLGRNYFIESYLGGGWEGEVYKVKERRSGLMRAAKIFHEGHRMGDRQMQRYANKMYRLRSCPIVTQYHHRDIARVGKEQVEILVSDFADGEVLSSFLARQPRKRLAPFEALHLIHAVASGVGQIHVRGEYHGDIHSDNIMVVRRGLGFEVRLVDFFDLGRSTREQIQNDVFDIIALFYEVIGEADGYRRVGPEIRSIIKGRRYSLVRKRFRTAGQLALALENMEWES